MAYKCKVLFHFRVPRSIRQPSSVVSIRQVQDLGVSSTALYLNEEHLSNNWKLQAYL